MIALPIACSLLFVIGVAIAGSEPPAPSSLPTRQLIPRQTVAVLSAGAGVGLLVLVTSGWVAPAAVAGAGAAFVVSSLQRRQRGSASQIVRMDALASWIETVRDVLLAGEQPVGAIVSSVRACPPPIRPQVRRLAIALGRQDPAGAMRAFANELDDPIGDLVAAGLAIAIGRGARTVPVLTALAEQTRQQVDRRRLIEAERAPARREVHALTAIMGALVVGLLVFGRSRYLDAYDSAGGQTFLAAALAAYAGLIVRVQRLARFPRPGRFLHGGSVAGQLGAP